MKISANQINELLSWKDLIEALRLQFQLTCNVPTRHHHDIDVPGKTNATMLIMPAWITGNRIGIKIANVFPDNTKQGLPSISADYFLYDGSTGQLLANLDGAMITSRRTAAASALAASYLSKENAETLFVVGAGKVASCLPEAMREVRPINRVYVWDIREEGANKLCETLCAQGFEATPQLDLHEGCLSSDIISCATLSVKPLVLGEWLQPGQHVDLIGSFTPSMREADDQAMVVSDVYIDTETALIESGDLSQPLKVKTISKMDIKGDLFDLCREKIPGRTNNEITLFKGVGTALEDLAAASLVYDKIK